MGCFRDDWKFSMVTPVYKQAGDINTPGNYEYVKFIPYFNDAAIAACDCIFMLILIYVSEIGPE